MRKPSHYHGITTSELLVVICWTLLLLLGIHFWGWMGGLGWLCFTVLFFAGVHVLYRHSVEPIPHLRQETPMTPQQALDDYHAALQAHDLDRTMALVDDDAVYLFSNEAAHHGRDAVRAAIAQNFEAIRDETYRVAGLRWLAESADVAVGVFEYHWSGQLHGEPASGRGRGSVVLRRSGEGWRIVHEHLSRGGLDSQ